MTRNLKHSASADADLCINLHYEHHIKKENEILSIFHTFFLTKDDKIFFFIPLILKRYLKIKTLLLIFFLITRCNFEDGFIYMCLYIV